MGRPRKTVLDRLRTVAWFHAMCDAAIARDHLPTGITPDALERALVRKHPSDFRSLDDAKLIRDYARGAKTPGPATLQRFENVYPGTRVVFDSGPDGSRLWSALTCRDARSAGAMLFELKHDIQRGVRAEKRVHRRPRTKRRKPGSTEVLVPHSAALTLGFSKAELEVQNARLTECLAKRPDLRDSLAEFLDGDEGTEVDEGLILQLTADLTFAAADRRRKSGAVRPALLAGLAMQILQARVDGATHLTLDYWRGLFVALRLVEFGLLEDEIERVSGLEFRVSEFTWTCAEKPKKWRRRVLK